MIHTIPSNATRMDSASTILSPVFRRTCPSYPTYTERLALEFELIDRNKFTRVFLQVQRIMELCKELSIPHIIRGSAGSSLVCYLLGISHTDPIQYNMDITRFMNHGRNDMPDIDIDVPYNRRDELYAAIGKTWPDQVARISNHVLYQYKSALQEALRIHAPKVTYRKNTPLESLVCDPELAATIRSKLHELLGTLRAESLHCGGIVIFDKEGSVPKDLVLRPTNIKNGPSAPVFMGLSAGLAHETIKNGHDVSVLHVHGSKTDGTLPQIKLNKDETEDSGYIKIDVLSNRGMAQWWDSATFKDLRLYPSYDAGVAELFRTGNTVGITFGESRGMRGIFKQLMPTDVETVAIALALIRPAAAAGGRKANFLAAYRSGILYTNDLEKPIVYDDDALARIRAAITKTQSYPKETLDSLADQFRKAFSKQRIADCLRFRDMCRLNGIPEPVIKRTIDDLNQLQYYSFCKSHALSYAQLVWALAYEKVHNPHAFWVATLNHCNSEYRRWVHWREARSSGLRLTRGQPPYRLGYSKTGAPMMIPASGEQLLLISDDKPEQAYHDMKTRGYWLGAAYFPGCYCRIKPVAQRRLKSSGLADTEYSVSFRGLIATGRVVRCDTDGEESESTAHAVTFLCIGYDNNKYLDLVIHGAKYNLLGYIAVEGKGKTTRPLSDDRLEVTSIKGVSLHSLLTPAQSVYLKN